jgi:hypothetical protein
MNLHHSFWYNYSVLWVALIFYTAVDIIIWPSYQVSGVSLKLYDWLWFSMGYGFMIVSAVTMFSIAIPLSIWLFNRLMVESLFYYLLQNRLPPRSLPWLALGTSTNLYVVSAAFIALSVALVYMELGWKKRLSPRRQTRDRALRYLRKFAEENGITEEYVIKAFDRATHPEEERK